MAHVGLCTDLHQSDKYNILPLAVLHNNSNYTIVESIICLSRTSPYMYQWYIYMSKIGVLYHTVLQTNRDHQVLKYLDNCMKHLRPNG